MSKKLIILGSIAILGIAIFIATYLFDVYSYNDYKVRNGQTGCRTSGVCIGSVKRPDYINPLFKEIYKYR